MSISAYIVNDLSSRLESGRELPVSELTLTALADHYKVSFTPVRSAVTRLIEDGLLEKRPNRRLVASHARGHSTKPSRSRMAVPNPPRDSYRVIADDLMQLSLQGQSVFLREEVTAEKYNVSRSAIRNILHRLAGEGILEHIPRRGWRLRAFRQDDLTSFNHVREAMELKALDLARPKLCVQKLQQMLDANTLPQSDDDWPQIDESFHKYLVTTAGNSYLTDFVDRQGRYFQLLFEWEDRDRETAINTVRQHRVILTAMLEKKWPAARKALSHHILNNHPVLSQITGNSWATSNGQPEQDHFRENGRE